MFKHNHLQIGDEVSLASFISSDKDPTLSCNIKYIVLGVGAGLGKIGKYCPVRSGFLRNMYVMVKKYILYDWLVVSLLFSKASLTSRGQ